MSNGYEIHKYYNAYGTLFWKRAGVYLKKWTLEGLPLVSYCEVPEGGFSEVNKKL